MECLESEGRIPSAADWFRQPLGRVATMALALVVVLVPAWLFADPLGTYRLYSDDFAYLASSRTFAKAWANLFRPHNTHIVPSWRLLTWGVSVLAGRLADLQTTLAAVSYGALVASMLLMGRLVARESGRAWLGFVAMVALGTTSVLESSATWYSSGQTLWASLGILATLHYLQGWRFRRGGWRLVAAAVSAWLAGGFWTIGHAAGPVGAAYLWADGRKRCRIAAIVPLAATAVTVVVALALGGRQIDSTISFHGRTVEKAVDLKAGAGHTLQAIPEDLVFDNLGLEVETTVAQGTALTALIVLAWLASLARRGRPLPIELAGGVLIVGAYYVEWIFRGYLPFSSLRGIVPWYDTIPHVGVVLFGMGWLLRMVGPRPGRGIIPLWRGAALGVLILQIALVIVHQPRVDALFEKGIPASSLEPLEAKAVTPALRLNAARLLAAEFARRQRDDLARLDRAEVVARKAGIDRDAIRQAFGRVLVLEIPKVYDAADMLILPESGKLDDPARVRSLLGKWLRPSKPPVIGLDSEGHLSIESGMCSTPLP